MDFSRPATTPHRRDSPRPGSARTAPSGSRSPGPRRNSAPANTQTHKVLVTFNTTNQQRRRQRLQSSGVEARFPKVICQCRVLESPIKGLERITGEKGQGDGSYDAELWGGECGPNRNISSSLPSSEPALYWSQGGSNLSGTGAVLGAVSLALCPLVGTGPPSTKPRET